MGGRDLLELVVGEREGHAAEGEVDAHRDVLRGEAAASRVLRVVEGRVEELLLLGGHLLLDARRQVVATPGLRSCRRRCLTSGEPREPSSSCALRSCLLLLLPGDLWNKDSVHQGTQIMTPTWEYQPKARRSSTF